MMEAKSPHARLRASNHRASSERSPEGNPAGIVDEESCSPAHVCDDSKPEDNRLAAATLEALVDTAVDGILTIDENGTVLSANRAVLTLFGYQPQELIGSDVTRLMPEPYHSEHPEYLRRYLSTNVPHVIGLGSREVRGRRKDGNEFPLELAVSEVQVPEGRIFAGILRDISERKDAEEALREAKDEAETAVRAKSDFLTNMNHELTTPLNFIVGFSEVLLDETVGPLNEKQRNYLTRILTGGRRLSTLLNDILDLSRVDSGRTSVVPSQFLLPDLLRECLVLHKEKAFKHAIDLDANLSRAEEVHMNTDPMILKQIIFHLLSNALKFTPDGGRVTLQVGASEECAGCVSISVADTGIGIDAADMPKLFKEFSQLESPYTKKYQGTGLGLALVKRLTDLLGGTVQAESRQGEGSRFSITIPATFRPV
jgi:PAS domain S-box-containing protein